MVRISVLFLSLLLVACATGPMFTDAPPPPEGAARIYIYRMPTMAVVARDARFYVDDKRVALLSADGYSYVMVQPGHHVLSQGWPFDVSFGRTIKVAVTLLAGETRYFRFSTDASFGVPMLQLGWQLAEVSPTIGQSEIAQRHFQKPETSDIVGK